MLKIGGFQKVSLIDYPDKICATIFVQGCNFRCPYCYNPGLANLYEFTTNNTNIREIRGKFVNISDLFDYLKKRKGMIEAVCVTGGEPTLQKDLPEFLGKIKEMGFLVKLDTNGSNPEMLKKLIKAGLDLGSPGALAPGFRAPAAGLVDYIAMDIKAPLIWERYKKAIGIDNKKIFDSLQESIKFLKRRLKPAATSYPVESIKFLKRRLKPAATSYPVAAPFRVRNVTDYEFRTTVVPGLLDKKDIIEIAKKIKGAKKYVLQGFVNSKEMIDPEYKKRKPYAKEILEEMVREAGRYVGKCEMRLN